MSEPRLISPLLDGYALGNSISDRSGVRCYPAMRNDSDERYIVKTISIPASQIQLEALLLTGAYPDAEAAGAYFRDLADEVRKEVEILNKLAAQRGFLPYSEYQIVPMEEGVGYEVYLLGSYKLSLERYLKRDPMTHLSAVNMGIDLCAALAVCREAGYLYVDLKPDNIYMPGQQEYYIGDLGFVALGDLGFASLPDRCRSLYTPPEISDAYAQLNTTMDTYALGLVLYQVYNNGQLPFDSAQTHQDVIDALALEPTLPPPAYADYEMAQIILKACARDPKDRYLSPGEMGQDLIAYMQRNDVNDVPIGPPVIDTPPLMDEEEPEEFEPETEVEEVVPSEPVEAEDSAPEAEPEEAPAADEAGSEPDPLPVEAAEEEPPVEAEIPEEPEPEVDATPEETPFEPEEAITEEASEPEEDWIDRMDAILAEDQPEEAPAEDSGEEPTLRELLTVDEEDVQEAEALTTEELTDETADILNLAQELIEHEAPQPVVAPEPIDVPIPEPIVLEDEAPEEAPAEADGEPPQEEIPDPQSEETPAQPEPSEEQLDLEKLNRAHRRKKIGSIAAAVILVAALAFGAWFFYSNYYLQTIDTFTVDGQADELVVNVVTDMDESLLTVVCKDTAGHPMTSALVNGQAAFYGLTPGTQYTVTLEVSGNHKLAGAISPCVYYTPAQTQIISFSATTGAEDGSAVISFGVEGPDSETWTLHYSTEGEEEQTLAFSGHTATVTGLTVGKTYLFSLTGDEDIYLSDSEPISFTATNVIYAENITVTGNSDGTITAIWTAPEGASVSGWVARCYNQDGFDQKLDVTETRATFTDVDAAAGYTIEITAAGMTQSKIVYITANSVTITDLQTQILGSTAIYLSWSYDGVAPENGWTVLCTVDGGAEPLVFKTTETSLTISPAAPGSRYDIVIQPTDSVSVFGGITTVDVPAITKTFSGYRLNAENIAVTTYNVPEVNGWNWRNLGESVNTFAPGGSMALLYRTQNGYNVSYNDITTLFVIRDSEGKLVSIETSTRTWKQMWDTGRCTETVANLPVNPGSYTLEIYLNNAKLAQVDFNIE